MSEKTFKAVRGNYVIFKITVDGLSRINEDQYSSLKIAKRVTERLLRENYSSSKLVILQIEATYWLDPVPALLNDMPQAVEAEPA